MLLRKTLPATALVALVTLTTPLLAAEIPVIVKIPRMTMEAAEKLAHATVMACRKEGIQIGVTVVDRGGLPIAVLRDTLAPPVTLEVSRQKAYTAVNFYAPPLPARGPLHQAFLRRQSGRVGVLRRRAAHRGGGQHHRRRRGLGCAQRRPGRGLRPQGAGCHPDGPGHGPVGRASARLAHRSGELDPGGLMPFGSIARLGSPPSLNRRAAGRPRIRTNRWGVAPPGVAVRSTPSARAQKGHASHPDHSGRAARPAARSA